MTNSMKDLLLGLGFKAATPAPAIPERRGPTSAQGRAAADPASRSQRTSVAGKGAGQRGHGHGGRREQGAGANVAQPSIRKSHASAAEIDLGKAFALRAQQEKAERIEAERLKQEAAARKRQAKAKVVELLHGKTLDDAAAELVRHFEYNGKIRRVHVTAAQFKALNAGELAVVQLDGRYLLVAADLARQVHDLLPSLVALLVDPQAPVADDPYADAKFAIPDDLTW